MKKGWLTTRLGEIAKTQYGLSVPMNEDRKGFKIFRMGEVQGGRLFDTGRMKYAAISAEEFERYKLRIGDVLFNRTNSFELVGKTGIFTLQGDYCFASYLVRLNLDRSRILPKFLNYFMNADGFQESVKEKASKSINQANINATILSNELIRFPESIREQQRIVGILDEAFEGIATAKANAEKNFLNARSLFEGHLQSVFSQRGYEDDLMGHGPSDKLSKPEDAIPNRHLLGSESYTGVTKTGGRQATLRCIPGEYSLAVGMPNTRAKKGWRWSLLTDLARLESGHTPSRRHPEYWGGSIPWIGIQDARERHGCRIFETLQQTNELGIANSSARVLPESTVCLSRTASVGYVVVMGRNMATSQDFVNWVCSKSIVPDFLKYIFLAEGRRGFLRFASGAVHQTIYFPEAKAFHVCHPTVAEQLRIVSMLDSLKDEIGRLEAIYERKLAALKELKKSLLHQAFSGNL